MLKERKELLEKEIRSLKEECGSLYFNIVTHKSGQHMLYSEKIHKLASLETDLKMVNELIAMA